MRRWKKGTGVLAIGFLALSLALAGCAGDDGSDGLAGLPGKDGLDGKDGKDGLSGAAVLDVSKQSAEALAAMTVTGEVTGVTIASPPVVRFKITDGTGRGVTGLGALRSQGDLAYMRFNVSKLVLGVDGSPDQWVNYVLSSGRPTNERNGTLADNGDGTYVYTFKTDVPDIATAGSLTFRVTIQVSGSGLPALNVVHDFVPAGGAVSYRRQIVTTAACNECHDALAFHGSRYEADYCVTCHNPGRGAGRTNTASAAGVFTGQQYIADGAILGDMTVMVHKIHMGHSLTKQGYDYAGVAFNHITYPQDPKNCRKCHTGADGDAWKTRPSRAACGSCHDGVDFASGHGGGVGGQTNDANCAGCHVGTNNGADIALAHLTNYVTTNNPTVPAGLANFTYEIASVTVDGVKPVVKFRIKKDGVALDLATFPPTGFTGGPSFLVAYAAPQGSVAKPADWNQIGKAAAQPATVSLANLKNSSQGTLAGPDADGYYTATLTVAAAAYPANATMRGVALQGYFTQTSPSAGRYTPSVIKNVAGEERREIVDNSKCLGCHEILSLHGGNRVNNVMVCAVCHNPNLSSSGRGADTTIAQWNTNSSTVETRAALGDNPLTYPEATQNMKEMVHGIHAASFRETAYEHVRDRGTSGVFYYDWSHITYPAGAENCLMCHKPGTYELSAVPAGALMTTDRTTTGNPAEDRATILGARGTVPNATDEVLTPIAGACFSCHDSILAKAHIQQNGGAIFADRSTVNSIESCLICHGPGKTSDVKVKHGIK